MDIKSQLIEILKKENYTFSQLADYLSMSENDLITDLNNKTLDLRVLELISKELRVPLYSFFRSENAKVDTYKKPYYVNKLWTSDDSIKKASKLKNQINLLKHIISLKEEQLKKIPS